jgi:hypothetical protein
LPEKPLMQIASGPIQRLRSYRNTPRVND